MRAASDELLLECGDGVTLQAFHSSPAKRGREPGKRLAVLLHGWEGSADSTYVLSLAQTLFAHGFEVVRLNLRDHGATHHLNRELFHSCRLPEVVGAVRALAQQFPGMPHGARRAFRWAAISCCAWPRTAKRAHLPIERVIAVSPVLDPGGDDDHARARLAAVSLAISCASGAGRSRKSSWPGPTTTISTSCCASAACAR